MKKLMTLLLVLVMVFSFVGCGQKSSVTEKPGNETSGTTKAENNNTNGTKKEYKIAFVAAGVFGDQGMNDAMLKGVETFTLKSGISVTSVEVTEFGDNIINARNFAEQGYDLIIMGAPVSDVIGEIAVAYPKTTFVLNKGIITDMDNVLSVTFVDSGGAFLAGAYAALMTKELGSKVKKVGWVGGMRIPDLEVSKYAFMAGSKTFGVETVPVYVGDFKDSAKAKEITLQMFNDGISIVQSFCGGAAAGVYQATESMDKGVHAMGAATGQFHLSDRIIASQVVQYDEMYANILLNYVENNGFNGMKEIVGDVANDGTGLRYAPDHEGMAPDSVIKQIEALKAKIISGEVVVPTTEEGYNAYTAN